MRLTERLEIGEVLKNGAIVLQRKKTDKPHADIVLCLFGHKFVTWIHHNDSGVCTIGHYYLPDELAEAVKDFKERD